MKRTSRGLRPVAIVTGVCILLLPILAGRAPAQESIQDTLVPIGRNKEGFEEYLWMVDSSVMIKIPAGHFTRGNFGAEKDEEPEGKVLVVEYYIDKYEVSNRQYRMFCDATGRPYPADPGFAGMPDYMKTCPAHPVVGISWQDATAYCAWAKKRLPTEAEWEKVARGADKRKYPWGNGNPTGAECNFADLQTASQYRLPWCNRELVDGYSAAAPVGSFPGGSSPYGAEDLAGNVWEWCQDWYSSEYYSISLSDAVRLIRGKGASNKTNPVGPNKGSRRVVRGGGWDVPGQFMRCSDRHSYKPDFADAAQGFRCAR